MSEERKPYYTPEILARIEEKVATVGSRADKMLLALMRHSFCTDRGREYAYQGFSRRVGVLRRCIENLFDIIPADRADVPSREELRDAEINIQAFIANCYGCVDNLAWIINFEKKLNLARKKVGLRSHNAELRAAVSPELRTYLDGLEQWFGYLVDYRDALAHRIPLYIPPGMVPQDKVDQYNELQLQINDALLRPYEYRRLLREQEQLLVFQPFMAHSAKEHSGLPFFHPQMLADFATVEELFSKVFSELAARAQ